MVKKQSLEKEKVNTKFNLEEMMGKGLHLGHQISKLHPKMSDNIMGVKNTVHIIDLEKTAKSLEEAMIFIEGLFREGGSIVLVGTKPPFRKIIQETAEECEIPYVVERWLGGTFTNHKVISNRTKYYQDIKKKKEGGDFESLTKKEKIRINKKLEKLRRKFEGIKDLGKIPEAVFVCDIYRDQACVKEANNIGVKVVAIVDTNVDPSLVDFPILANDDAIPSVQYILDKLKEAIMKSKIPMPNNIKSNPKSK